MEKHIFNEKKASDTFTGIQLTKKTEGISNEIIEKEEDSSVEFNTEKRENILNHFKHPICNATYNKSYSRTWLESSIVEYTWEINSAITIFKTEEEFFSARFPKTSLYRIKLSIDNDTSDVMKNKLRFYLVSGRKFKGICDVCVVNPVNSQKIKCKSISGLISNMILLYETTLESLKKYLVNNKIVMYFKIEFIHKFFTQSIHIGVPLNTTLYEELNFDRSMLINCKFNYKGSITFKVRGECYNLPLKALYDTNSKYFKSICDYAKLANKEDTPYEIEIDEMPEPFKQMLSFILSDFIPDPFNYHMLRDLLEMAHRYDVQTLKSLCESYLIRMINIENSIDLIQLAFSCNAKSLKKYTLQFIKLYLKEIVHTQEFERLSQNNLNKIIKLLYDINLSLDMNLAQNILLNIL